MWAYNNPVQIRFGAGAIDSLAEQVRGRHYAVVTYPDPYFAELTAEIAEQSGPATLIVDDVAPNPDFKHLLPQCVRFAELESLPDVIVALGGGSVIDSAKVFAAAGGSFPNVARFIETGQDAETFANTPIIAVPTTAGTGSEVTCWATVWDEARGKKFSLARKELYPEAAIVDPALMLGKPYGLTLSTGLDTLSHALESIWNVNANPISARFAVASARRILRDLPNLLGDLQNLDLRASMAEASLMAGLAFSNTKTAIAHNISYPITLGCPTIHPAPLRRRRINDPCPTRPVSSARSWHGSASDGKSYAVQIDAAELYEADAASLRELVAVALESAADVVAKRVVPRGMGASHPPTAPPAWRRWKSCVRWGTLACKHCIQRPDYARHIVFVISRGVLQYAQKCRDAPGIHVHHKKLASIPGMPNPMTVCHQLVGIAHPASRGT